MLSSSFSFAKDQIAIVGAGGGLIVFKNNYVTGDNATCYNKVAYLQM